MSIFSRLYTSPAFHVENLVQVVGFVFGIADPLHVADVVAVALVNVQVNDHVVALVADAVGYDAGIAETFAVVYADDVVLVGFVVRLHKLGRFENVQVRLRAKVLDDQGIKVVLGIVAFNGGYGAARMRNEVPEVFVDGGSSTCASCPSSLFAPGSRQFFVAVDDDIADAHLFALVDVKFQDYAGRAAHRVYDFGGFYPRPDKKPLSSK